MSASVIFRFERVCLPDDCFSCDPDLRVAVSFDLHAFFNGFSPTEPYGLMLMSGQWPRPSCWRLLG